MAEGESFLLLWEFLHKFIPLVCVYILDTIVHTIYRVWIDIQVQHDCCLRQTTNIVAGKEVCGIHDRSIDLVGQECLLAVCICVCVWVVIDRRSREDDRHERQNDLALLYTTGKRTCHLSRHRARNPARDGNRGSLTSACQAVRRSRNSPTSS